MCSGVCSSKPHSQSAESAKPNLSRCFLSPQWPVCRWKIVVWVLYWPNQPSGKTWADHYIQVANRTLWPASAPEANWHHGLCTLRLQRSGTDGPPHPPGLFHLAETETPVMAAGWVNHQQAVGNGGRPAPHHPIPGNMWTEGLTYSKHGWSTAEEEEEEKEEEEGPPVRAVNLVFLWIISIVFQSPGWFLLLLAVARFPAYRAQA